MDLPIACNLTAPELARRVAELRKSVLAEAIRVEACGEGLRWHFESTPDLLTRLAPVIDEERACCPFMEFALKAEPNGGSVTLEVTGPQGTADFLREWVTHHEGHVEHLGNTEG